MKAGDLLLTFDMDAIKEAGYDVTVPVVICEKGNYTEIECFHGKETEAGEVIIRLREK